MKLSLEKVRKTCRRQEKTLNEALGAAGVSRNAFYTLGRKESVVPRSLQALAATLDVPVSDLCEEVPTVRAELELLVVEAGEISRRHRTVDPDNIRHTLLLLNEGPVDRLRRALRRGRQLNLR